MVEVLFLAVQDFNFLVYSEPDSNDFSLLVCGFCPLILMLSLHPDTTPP
jgi:hypothetical protein